VALKGNAYCRVCHRCRDTAMGYSNAVSQIVAECTVEGNAVTVHAAESHPEQRIERHSG